MLLCSRLKLTPIQTQTQSRSRVADRRLAMTPWVGTCGNASAPAHHIDTGPVRTQHAALPSQYLLLKPLVKLFVREQQQACIVNKCSY